MKMPAEWHHLYYCCSEYNIPMPLKLYACELRVIQINLDLYLFCTVDLLRKFNHLKTFGFSILQKAMAELVRWQQNHDNYYKNLFHFPQCRTVTNDAFHQLCSFQHNYDNYSKVIWSRTPLRYY